MLTTGKVDSPGDPWRGGAHGIAEGWRGLLHLSITRGAYCPLWRAVKFMYEAEVVMRFFSDASTVCEILKCYCRSLWLSQTRISIQCELLLIMKCHKIWIVAWHTSHPYHMKCHYIWMLLDIPRSYHEMLDMIIAWHPCHITWRYLQCIIFKGGHSANEFR
jgi:hypothetical protein